MIPQSVRFTGVTIPTAKLLYGYERKFQKVPPAHWERIEVSSSPPSQNGQSSILHAFVSKHGMTELIDAWLDANIDGRWASIPIRHQTAVAVFFEDASDALLFRLKDGMTAWQETVNN
jgi:hypothetical protein